MPRPFSPTTAEHAVGAVEAVVANGQETSPAFVAAFLDIPEARAEAGLLLAADLGLLQKQGARFEVASPFCRLVASPSLRHKAQILRVILEGYQPFVTFRERLISTLDAETAAQQTRAVLDLDAHRDEVMNTLVSLGTFAQALNSEGGGTYAPADKSAHNVLEGLASACGDIAAAELRVRVQLGESATEVPHAEVIAPLADAVLRAATNDARGAVTQAGNAVESFLALLAPRLGVNVIGAHGVNAKVDRFVRDAALPTKIAATGKHLGHVRNAADHGVDTDIGAPWDISGPMGIEYVFAACTFIRATVAWTHGTFVL